MAVQDLFESARIAAFNNVSKLATGQPVPGSLEDKQRKLENARLDQQLKQELNPKAGETPEAFQRRLAGLQDILLQYQQKQGKINLELAGGEGTGSQLDIRRELERLGMQRENSRTQNEKDLIAAQNAGKLQLLNPVLEQERWLAGGSDADARKDVLNFLAAAQDKNLAAQAAARKPNYAPALLGGLLYAATSLVG
jgi:hypothetical protein